MESRSLFRLDKQKMFLLRWANDISVHRTVGRVSMSSPCPIVLGPTESHWLSGCKCDEYPCANTHTAFYSMQMFVQPLTREYSRTFIPVDVFFVINFGLSLFALQNVNYSFVNDVSTSDELRSANQRCLKHINYTSFVIRLLVFVCHMREFFVFFIWLWYM